MSTITSRQKRYFTNKGAKTGEIIVCPTCHAQFKKVQYSQVFCCRQCKDKFWNDKGDRHTEEYYIKEYFKNTNNFHYKYGPLSGKRIIPTTYDDMKEIYDMTPPFEDNIDEDVIEDDEFFD